jgi:hypothetical protein
MLDRFDAAHRRERGDCAKMREALVKIEKIAHCDLCNVYPKYRDKFNDKIGGIEREARAALAAPPRNCDRPECATTKAAQDMWRREDGGKTAYYEWLLATYKEGGNDGR